MFEALLTSTGLVALAEIGDKTMLLAIVLATRFRRPLPIIAGIFVATILNHALAAWAGSLAAGFFEGRTFRLFVAASFIAMGLWTLMPDKFDESEAPAVNAHGVFVTTLVAFFVVEIGDKTQLATVALGARYHDVLAVAAGTTIGMMVANAPAVLLGDALVKRVSLNLVRLAAAASFIALGIWMLVRTL
jgi:putative Ca2+/H+ antiporter (TMEM165/GDT1 family)